MKISEEAGKKMSAYDRAVAAHGDKGQAEGLLGRKKGHTVDKKAT